MKESSTYQAILAEGEAMGRAQERVASRRETLLELGTKRFGQPEQRIRQLIENVSDAERLAKLCTRLLDVESWQDLLA